MEALCANAGETEMNSAKKQSEITHAIFSAADRERMDPPPECIVRIEIAPPTGVYSWANVYYRAGVNVKRKAAEYPSCRAMSS